MTISESYLLLYPVSVLTFSLLFRYIYAIYSGSFKEVSLENEVHLLRSIRNYPDLISNTDMKRFRLPNRVISTDRRSQQRQPFLNKE